MALQRKQSRKMQPTIQRALLLALLSFTTASAQAITTNDTCSSIDQPERCCPAFLKIPYISSPNASVISTGSVAFVPPSNEHEWRLSVLVNYTGLSANGIDHRYSRESFLSVSNSAPNTSVCVYRFSPLNATKTTNGSGCSGVFSDECMAFIQQAVYNSTNASWKPGDDCRDPFFIGVGREERLVEVCGKILTPNEQAYSRERFVIPNENCSYPSLSGIELPNNYHTPAHGSSHYLYREQGYRSGYSNIRQASTYDQFLSQVIPFAIVTSQIEGNQNNAVEIVCVTPNHTQPNAPEISDGTPWEEDVDESTGTIQTLESKIIFVLAGLAGLILAV